MADLIEIVDSLEVKIEKLLQKQSVLKKKNHSLEADLNTSHQNAAQLQLEIKKLEGRNQSLKAANAILGSKEHKRETKLKINGLIREIDQCIVQLSE